MMRTWVLWSGSSGAIPSTLPKAPRRRQAGVSRSVVAASGPRRRGRLDLDRLAGPDAAPDRREVVEDSVRALVAGTEDLSAAPPEARKVLGSDLPRRLDQLGLADDVADRVDLVLGHRVGV